MTVHDFSEAARHTGDIVSVSVVVATLAQWLPSIAAGLSIIWTGIRIYEYLAQKRAGKNVGTE